MPNTHIAFEYHITLLVKIHKEKLQHLRSQRFSKSQGISVPIDFYFIDITRTMQRLPNAGLYRYRPTVVANGVLYLIKTPQPLQLVMKRCYLSVNKLVYYLRATNEMKKLACPGRDSLSNEIMDCGLSMIPLREVNKLPAMVTPKKMLKTLK
mgnify:CR=1 FL=1